MPTPLELLLDPISIAIFVIYGLLIGWEALRPAHKLQTSPYWKTRGLLSFSVFFYLSSYLPLIWDHHLAIWQLLDLSQLDTAAATLAGLFVYELGVYIWHRAMHKSNTLWRIFHQMHHSAERVDTWGAFWFSPFDMIGWTFLGSLTLTLAVGVPAEAATNIILITSFFAIFQHANIRTPKWLGYIIQRPESHSIHHAKGVHAWNYSDLPIFDIIFGTFQNPQIANTHSGLFPGASNEVADMLMWKDLSNSNTKVRGDIQQA